MAAFRINLGIGKTGFCPSSFFLLLVAHCQFVATSITWTAPPPAWNQTDTNDIRTVDILVFNRSTQVQLKWNYILPAGSNLQLTTFSIIDEGSSTDIGLKFSGSGTPTIFDDYRARFNISTSEVATLIIKRATEREETTFQCQLSTTNPWRYRVRVKLTELQIQWDQLPLNLSTVDEGNNVTLHWRYSYTLGLSPSFREATIFDLRDGDEKRIANKLLQNDLYVVPAYRDRFKIHIEDTKASMTILTARRSDSGRYKFEVETLNNDKLGGLTSTIEISVQFAANLTNVSRDQIVREDSNLQLLCEATGVPTPTITWTRVLEDDSNSEIMHHGQTWDFSNISRTASGTYRCTADNGFGNPVSHKVKVNVTYPAKIVKLKSEHEVARQQNVSLDCQAEGNPQPTYSWTPCDPQQSVCHESTLNISEVLSDVVYTCNVTNSLGNDARNTSVVVASTVINVTLVITSESCTDGQFSDTDLLRSKLQETVDGIFTSDVRYQNSALLDVRCGSVIVDLALEFNSTVKENDVLRTLQDAAKDGKLGDFDVNTSSIVGMRPQTGATASTTPTSSPETVVTPTAIQDQKDEDQKDEDKSLNDWMIAVIASVAGVVLIVILVFLIYWFTIRKKTDGDDDVDISPTLRYVVGGPSVSRSMDRRSYGMESVEDDPFILAASTHSLNSIGDSKKANYHNVNYGYSSEDSVRPQPEMLLKPGSRVSSNTPTAQSTGMVVANSSYLVRGPQRDLNTLPLRREPPSFEEATLQSETNNGYYTEPGARRYGGFTPKPSQAATSGRSKGPLDPTVPYAIPHKKKISNKPPIELHGSTPGNPPQYNQTERSGDSMLELALDDPSNLPPTDNLQAMSDINKDDPHYDLPEPPANFKSAVGRDSRSDSDGAILNPPASTGRKKLPYFNVHGQLVRPALQDSGDVRRPEPPRTTRNTFSPDQGIPLHQVQPRGSESEDTDEQDNDNITYVV